MLQKGQGFATDHLHWRLFVEVTDAGWTAYIQDLNKAKSIWRRNVASPDVGKEEALSMLSALSGIPISELQGLEWLPCQADR